MPAFSFDDGIVETDYTSSSTPSPIDYFTGLTSLNFVITGFDSLYDMGIGLFNERDWKEWEDWYSEWSETDPSIVSSGKTWAELD